jgi:DNA polymerase sigma
MNPLTSALKGLSMSKKKNAATSETNSEKVDLDESLMGILKFYGEEFDYERNAIEIESVIKKVRTSV